MEGKKQYGRKEAVWKGRRQYGSGGGAGPVTAGLASTPSV